MFTRWHRLRSAVYRLPRIVIHDGDGVVFDFAVCRNKSIVEPWYAKFIHTIDDDDWIQPEDAFQRIRGPSRLFYTFSKFPLTLLQIGFRYPQQANLIAWPQFLPSPVHALYPMLMSSRSSSCQTAQDE